MSVYSLNGDTFTRDGQPIEGITATQTPAGRWQYRRAGSRQIMGGGMNPREFATRYFYAARWEDPLPTDSELAQLRIEHAGTIARELHDLITQRTTTERTTTQAQTLRDAANAVPIDLWTTFHDVAGPMAVGFACWLRDRADTIEAGDTPE